MIDYILACLLRGIWARRNAMRDRVSLNTVADEMRIPATHRAHVVALVTRGFGGVR